MDILRLCAENFNPQILYIGETMHKDKLETKYHCHDYLELSYVLSGHATYKINDTFYKVKAGDLLPFNPNVYHGQYLSNGEQLHEIHIGIKNLQFNSLPEDYIINENYFSIVDFSKQDNDFLNCCEEIIKEQKSMKPGYDLVLKSLVMRLIVILLREVGSFEEGDKDTLCAFEFSEKANIVGTIISFMKENYMKDISLDKISKNMYLSPVYISKIFKEEVGNSPINYLIKIRLEKACNLLRKNKETSIKEISKLVGYDDAYYFSKLFKKYYGFSPMQFKRENLI
jgi:AraC-like DNA-binding protein